MRRILLAAALLTVTAPAMGQATEADAEKEVARLSQRVYEAYVKVDTSFLDGALADDWMVITPSGNTRDKAQLLKELKDGTIKFDAMDESNVKVRVYGDAAIVTGRLRSKEKLHGQEVGGLLRYTQVFVRQGGKWRCVSSQATRIAAPSGGSGEKP
jgi:ketosteroid isomerase-like protein